jgi:hypothetical protein
MLLLLFNSPRLLESTVPNAASRLDNGKRLQSLLMTAWLLIVQMLKYECCIAIYGLSFVLCFLSQALYRRGFARLHLGLLVEAEVTSFRQTYMLLIFRNL